MNSLIHNDFNRPLALLILLVMALLIFLTLQLNPAPLQHAFAESNSITASR